MANFPQVCIRYGVALLFCLPAAQAQKVQYSFEYHGQEQGLASSLVRSLTQDKEGFIWVGTPIGLFRWDGFRFRKYSKEDGLPGLSVRSLHVDREGTLWAGTSAGIARKEGNRFVMASDKDLDAYGRTGLGSDRQGVLFAASHHGIYSRRNGGRFEKLRLSPEIDTAHIPGLFVDRDDSIWFGCTFGICRWDGSALQRYGVSEGVPKDIYGGFERDRDGSLLARGVKAILAQPNGEQGFRLELNAGGEGSFQLLSDARGRLIAPSWDGLWMRSPAGAWSLVTEDNGLPANRINAVWADQEGALWLGFSDFGVARWRGIGDWEGYNRSSGLPSNAVTAFFRDTTGRMWVGTKDGLATSYNHQNGFVPFPPIGKASIRAIVQTPDGWVWVAAYEEGLWRIHSKTMAVERIGAESGAESNQIIALHLSRDGSLWLSRRAGLFRTRTGAPPRFLPALRNVLQQSEQIYAIREDASGHMWMSGTRGVLLLENGKWRRFSTGNGLLHNTVVLLSSAPDGDIWLGYGRYVGVTRLRLRAGKTEFTHYDSASVLASNDLCFLVTDSRGWLWVGTDNGIDVFNGRQWRHIASRDGLIWHDTVFNAFWEDSQTGAVWIGTNRGMSRFLPHDSLFQRAPPSITITGVSVGGRLADHRLPVETHYSNRMLSFGFSTLSFAQSAEARFRYRLKGLDSQWIETAEREASFPNLNPGVYQFEVQAGSFSTWNPHSAVVHFSILAPWWRTYWFSFAIILLILALAYAFHRHRVHRIQRKRAELQLAVAERTIELQREKNRTEAEKQTVEQQKREIESLLAQAREVARLKDEFLANVSHEIRTPMNGILGMTSLALQTNLRPDQREYLECARSSGEALLSLLNDILDFSKIEANRLELESVPFSPAALVQDCIRAVRPSIGEKPIRLECSAAADVPHLVLGDPTRLRQILLNLLSNAIKFTNEGFVSARLSAESFEQDAVRLEFRVIDTGEGIAPEKHKLIFEAFRQADGSTTRRFGGTGLGLAICERLIALMRGDICVESELGRGSEFIFHIPFRVCSPNEAPLKAKPSTGELGRLAAALAGREGKTLRILVAEDNPINQKLVVRMLERQGHEVEVAADGKQAYMLTAHKHYDLVLMDVQMPELDGLQATRLIREREAKTGGRLPILMLTANAMPGDKEKCLEAGADAYLSKPVSFDKLTTAVIELTSVTG